jgi:hypothetical protein
LNDPPDITIGRRYRKEIHGFALPRSKKLPNEITERRFENKLKMQFCEVLLEAHRPDRHLEHFMIWLFVAFVILFPIVLAGRAHSRYLDAQQARWTVDPTARSRPPSAQADRAASAVRVTVERAERAAIESVPRSGSPPRVSGERLRATSVPIVRTVRSTTSSR